MDALTHVEVFIGGPPLLELRLAQGLLEFGREHPQWRFSLRGADFRYSATWLKDHRVSGALVLLDAAPVERVLNDAGVPWVHMVPGTDVPHHTVNVDDRAIGRMGAEAFLERGFSRFAFCGVDTLWSGVRAEGFSGRLAEDGHACDRTEIAFSPSQSWTLQSRTKQRLTRWVSQLKKHTAVMAAHDVAASRLIDVCVYNGVRVPEDVAVLGVGNHELICELSPVPVSSIDTAFPEVAQHAAHVLEALIEKRRVTQPHPLVKPSRIVERRSTEVLAFDDALVGRLVAYIRDHVCDGLTVEQLVSAFNLSRRTLARRFSDHLGRTPGAEIRMARLRHAKGMLTHTTLTFTEIAMACGFSDLPHMDRSFRTAYDMTPSALRHR